VHTRYGVGYKVEPQLKLTTQTELGAQSR